MNHNLAVPVAVVSLFFSLEVYCVLVVCAFVDIVIPVEIIFC